MILNNVYKKFHEFKTINERGLVAAIDYALNEIFSKKTLQKEIAKRHGTSPTTLINNRYIIAPCIPWNIFTPFLFQRAISTQIRKRHVSL